MLEWLVGNTLLDNWLRILMERMAMGNGHRGAQKCANNRQKLHLEGLETKTQELGACPTSTGHTALFEFTSTSPASPVHLCLVLGAWPVVAGDG